MPNPKAKIDINAVEELAGKGLSLEQIATNLGISDKTLLRHRKESKEMSELSEAIKRGKAKRIKEVVNKLHTLIDNGNPAAIFFFLKTQGGWKETMRQEVSGANGAPIEMATRYDLSNFTPEQLAGMVRDAYANKA